MGSEFPVVFDCAGDQLLGIVHRGGPDASVGAIIVVGGPQYRVGSHRQFVLMARHLAAGGIPVLRFDYRGMADSSGEPRDFENIDQDIQVAIDCLLRELPSIKSVILLGLCDAASAIMMYGHTDARVTGMLLMNPWVQTGASSSRIRLRYYYLPRLLQSSFWRKVLTGRFSPVKSIGAFMKSLRETVSPRKATSDGRIHFEVPFIERMLFGLERFSHPILLLLSGRDLANREFLELRRTDRRWRNAVDSSLIDTEELPDADHTLSARKDLESAAGLCLDWLRKTQGLCVD